MIKYLDINLKDSFVSECWTFYKSCIISSYLYGRQWMASHMEVYLDGGCSAFWGNDIYYPLDYYDDILKISSANINEITCDNLVTYIKQRIDTHTYIILDADYSIIFNHYEDGTVLHEILIFGYDDEEKVFLCPTIERNIIKVSYKNMKSSYSLIRDIYLNDPVHRYNRRLEYFFPITEIKIRNLSINNDEFIFSCIRKIRTELKSDKYTIERNEPDKINIDPRYVYRGLSMLNNLYDFLTIYLKDNTSLENLPINLTLTLLKLHEHRVNLSYCLEYIVNEFAKNIKLKSLFNDYLNIIQNIQRAYFITHKSILDNIPYSLSTIQYIVKGNIVKERFILKEFYEETEKQILTSYRNTN